MGLLRCSHVLLFVAIISIHLLKSAFAFEVDALYNEMDASIAKIEAKIAERKSLKLLSDAESAMLWTSLGSLLVFKDVRYHEDGFHTRLKALEAYNNAIASCPKHEIALLMTAHHKRGMLLKLMGNGQDAILSHELAYSLAGNDLDRSICLQFKAAAVDMIGNASYAVELYRQALTLAPSQLGIYHPMVSCLVEVGQSTSQWMRLLKQMERTMKGLEEEEEEEAPQGVLSLEYDAGLESAQFHWALYIVAEKAGQLDLAWTSLQRAHELQIRKVGLPDDGEHLRQQKDNTIRTFVSGFWDPVIGHPSRTPVFIIGMVRSGSTLLETMLDAHPQIWGLGEDSVLNTQLPRFRNSFVKEISKGDLSAANAVVAESGDDILKKMKEILAADPALTPKKKASIRRIVDKMLFNYNNIGLIHMLYPKAAILHMIRDPMDTIFSCYKHKFDEVGLRWSLDFEQIVNHYVVYLEIMAHFRKVLPGRVMDIRYEGLVSQPEVVMKKVLKRVGVPWDPSILEFHSSNRTVHTHSSSRACLPFYIVHIVYIMFFLLQRYARSCMGARSGAGSSMPLGLNPS